MAGALEPFLARFVLSGLGCWTQMLHTFARSQKRSLFEESVLSLGHSFLRLDLCLQLDLNLVLRRFVLSEETFCPAM